MWMINNQLPDHAFINFYGTQHLIENRILTKDRDARPFFEGLNIDQILFFCVGKLMTFFLILVLQNFRNFFGV